MITGPAGSVGIFCNLCWHAVNENHSESDRIAAQVSAQKASLTHPSLYFFHSDVLLIVSWLRLTLSWLFALLPGNSGIDHSMVRPCLFLRPSTTFSLPFLDLPLSFHYL